MVRFEVLPFLGLLFVGTLCGSMIMPYMAYFIVEGLGRDPWAISLYAGAVAVLVVLINRRFAKWMDAGTRPFPLIGMAAAGFLTATAALSLIPAFWTVLSFGVLGFAVSSSAMSTMFSLGGIIAQHSAIERTSFNAYMRATTSTAWMVGPALSFVVADQVGPVAVFQVAVGVGLIWLGLWWWVAPRDAAIEPTAPGTTDRRGSLTVALWIAVSFVFCLSVAHFMTFTALPLFFVQEVGLPGYAPGHAFSVKTFVEVLAILLTPILIARVGIRRSLLATGLLAVVAIQFLASVQSYPQMLLGAALEGFYYGLFSTLAISFVQSFAEDRPAYATAMYWNTLMVTGLLGGPAAGLIAQIYDFRTVILVASAVALFSVLILAIGSRHPQVRSVSAS
ncbi:MFS transporter [uncultured Roseobacter sp.]|uniref:MFS transporter n=1 Tax=uncultured Roseobacter sp. TaxID=114847 RepID=UPI002605F077|nr:MFS transporter [uncultured Roseobacter sp.]